MINGIDVSKWQGDMDWAKAKDAGVQFAIIRAGSINNTTGVCYTDDQYHANVAGCYGVGIPYAAYWFFRPNHSAARQADYFLNLADSSGVSVQLWCDVETAGRASVVKDFCARLSTTWKVGIYSNPNTIKYLLTGDKAWMSQYPLWLADWTPPANVPAPWSSYLIWQYGVEPDGPEYGAQSASIDHDYALEEFVTAYPPPPDDGLEARVTALEAEVADLEQRVTALENKPPAQAHAHFIVCPEGALARCISGYNKATPQKPIFAIYPDSSASSVPARIRWPAGVALIVDPVPVLGDSSELCYSVTDWNGTYPIPIYIRIQDGVLNI